MWAEAASEECKSQKRDFLTVARAFFKPTTCGEVGGQGS